MAAVNLSTSTYTALTQCVFQSTGRTVVPAETNTTSPSMFDWALDERRQNEAVKGIMLCVSLFAWIVLSAICCIALECSVIWICVFVEKLVTNNK